MAIMRRTLGEKHIEGICTLEVDNSNSFAFYRCTPEDIILPRGFCKNYYFNIGEWLSITLSFVISAIESILSIIPKESKLVVYDSSCNFRSYKDVAESFSQVIYRA